METIISNWYIIVACIAVIALAIINIVDFFKLPTSEQKAAIREWMLFAVISAEKKLGSGTGKLKLRYVYDLFLEKFPTLSQYFSFDQFSEYVDSALEEMRKLLETNEKINAYVNEN